MLAAKNLEKERGPRLPWKLQKEQLCQLTGLLTSRLFWSKSPLFQATEFVVICYKSNRKLAKKGRAVFLFVFITDTGGVGLLLGWAPGD